MNTRESRRLYARQHEIRMALRAEYAQNAVNEVFVATIRHEMGTLPHRHEWLRDVADTGTRECRWCDFGTDAYYLDTATVIAEARASEAAGDALIRGFTDALDVPAEPVRITVATNYRGDLEVHMSGCKDLLNPRHIRQESLPGSGQSEPGQQYEGRTLAEAIVAADTDWAEAFGYTYPVAPENRGEVWSIHFGTIQQAPCIRKAARAARG